MVFNLVFKNVDDHLKNHSFIYDKDKNSWNLSPAYDLTYALNPLLTFTNVSRALSINGKRQDINWNDLLTIAEEFAVKNPTGILSEVQNTAALWKKNAESLNIQENIINAIENDFIQLM